MRLLGAKMMFLLFHTSLFDEGSQRNKEREISYQFAKYEIGISLSLSWDHTTFCFFKKKVL